MSHAQARPKKKWNTGVLLFTIYLFLGGLIALSLVSFIQTEIAFREVNDANITFFKLPIGIYMSVFFAFIFQYGQGTILYVRREFLSGKTLFRIVGASVSEKTLAMFTFIVFATVDAGTNVLWLYQVYNAPDDKIKAFLVQAVLYSAMVLSVFAEEVLGTVLDARARVQGEFNYILEQENKLKESKKKTTKSSGGNNTSYQYKKPLQQQQGKTPVPQSKRKDTRKSKKQTRPQEKFSAEPTYHNLSAPAKKTRREEEANEFMKREGYTIPQNEENQPPWR